jgi:hypothetical protein
LAWQRSPQQNDSFAAHSSPNWRKSAIYASDIPPERGVAHAKIRTHNQATWQKNEFYCVCNKTSITPHIGRNFAVRRKQIMLILLIILILVFGFGGYRMGPGLGYYGGGGISLILLIVLILLLLKVI